MANLIAIYERRGPSEIEVQDVLYHYGEELKVVDYEEDFLKSRRTFVLENGVHRTIDQDETAWVVRR